MERIKNKIALIMIPNLTYAVLDANKKLVAFAVYTKGKRLPKGFTWYGYGFSYPNHVSVPLYDKQSKPAHSRHR